LPKKPQPRTFDSSKPNQKMDILIFACRMLAFLCIIDFLTGLFHFIIDQYLTAHTPIIGRLVVETNNVHHRHPREILKHSYLKLTYMSWLAGVFIILGLKSLGYFSWAFTAVIVYGAHANVIHLWAHRTRRENGPLISFLQDSRLIQSRRHHGWHHRAPFDTHYCILTNFLNPVLSKIRFWEGLMFVLAKGGLHPVQK
jgi:plasmanylethanolamine desaturase